MTLDQVYTENSIRTYTGKVFDLMIMDPDSICIEDIAHALSNTARWAGHLDKFYSVAQHSYYVALNATKENKLAALLHDASEAYIGDMPSPFKKMMPEYKEIENRLMTVIAKKFGFQYPFSPEIKQLDERFLNIEWDAFVMKKHHLPAFTPEYAKQHFMDMYNSIVNSK